MKRMLIDDTQPEETRVVIVDGNKVEDVEFESSLRKQLKGNIFNAKVVRIEPSLQAAFIDYGGKRHGFLAFGEIHPDYYAVSDEVRAEVEKEVDEIIEKKRQFLTEKKAERERRRLEREQKRAEYEARRDAEREAARLAVSENSAQTAGETAEVAEEEKETTVSAAAVSESAVYGNSEQKQTTETDGCGCPPDCACRKEDGHCHCQERGECTCDKCCGNGEACCCAAEKENAEASSDGENEEEKNFRRSHRRGTRFLGRRPSRKALKAPEDGEYKISGETAGAGRGEMLAEDVSEEDCEDYAAGGYDCQNTKYHNNNDDNDDDIDVGGDDEDEDDDIERSLEVTRRLVYARKLYRHCAIQDVIREGQTLLVQIVKEERGNKGAACTTYLSLAGRYCVLMPNRIKSGGVSRKITTPEDRRRLKEIMHTLPIGEDMSLIIRTAGEDKDKDEISRDYNYLMRTWNHIRHHALSTPAPALIYEEGDLIKRALRDMYSKDIGEVIIDGDNAYKTAREFCKILSPNMGRKIKCRRPGEIPVFQHYQVEKELDKLHNPVVQLASGGYLVINPTEALVSIDVNSGRATREMDIEETALKTNLEAADEIAKQLRMRNLAGLVVVDFIDMEEQANNHAVEKRMKEAMKADRARVQIAKMSMFGLLEISRQRMHSSFMESNYITCPYCRGQGVIRSTESGAMLVLRALEEEGIKGTFNRLEVILPPDTAVYILNHKRRQLADMEEKYRLEIIVSADSAIKNISDYKIEKKHTVPANDEKTVKPSAYSYAEDCCDDEEVEEDNSFESDNDGEQENFRRGKRMRHRRRRGGRERRNRYGSDERRADTGVAGGETPTSPDSVEEEKPAKKTWWKKLIG